MWRLRTTTMLSVLALAIGIGGTHWLSGRSTDEPLALNSTALSKRSAPTRHRVAPTHHGHLPANEMAVHRWPKKSPSDIASAPVSTAENRSDLAMRTTPELVPLYMPIVRDEAYEKQLGHLDGRVVMRVSIDGAGDVSAVDVMESSGDKALDAHALRSVRQWRFAVPPDHPDGFSAVLPMRFSSHDEPLASVP